MSDSPICSNASKYSIIRDELPYTSYMWTENRVLPSEAAAAIRGAADRLVLDKSWHQLGASTTRVWVKPAARISLIASMVAGSQSSVLLLHHGSLPRLIST